MASLTSLSWYCVAVFLLLGKSTWSTNLVNSNVDCGQRTGRAIDNDLDDTEQKRVVGGTPTTTESFPWMVMLKRYGHSGVLCGGAIISESLVLTAAHCFDNVDKNDVYMWAGRDELDIFSPFQQIISVLDIIVHESYNSTTKRNDIALVTTSSNIRFNSHVAPLSLPSPAFHVQGQQQCQFAGYGDTQGTGPQRRLNNISVPILNNLCCSRTDWLGDNFDAVSDVSICAGYADGGPDACAGDSGGVLVCTDTTSDTFCAYGIASWGKGCGEARRPGVYVRVTDYTDWINSKTESFLVG